MNVNNVLFKADYNPCLGSEAFKERSFEEKVSSYDDFDDKERRSEPSKKTTQPSTKMVLDRSGADLTQHERSNFLYENTSFDRREKTSDNEDDGYEYEYKKPQEFDEQYIKLKLDQIASQFLAKPKERTYLIKNQKIKPLTGIYYLFSQETAIYLSTSL